MQKARERLKFEELFYIQMQILRQMKRREQNHGFCMPIVGKSFHAFYQNCLPFPLTNAQKRVIREIQTDLKSGKQMNRLFVQALIDEYRFDLVILLENNTPWVADGLRSLGSSVDRKEFQNLLVEMLEENNIEFVRVEEDDYDSRFLRCVELVREKMREQR